MIKKQTFQVTTQSKCTGSDNREPEWNGEMLLVYTAKFTCVPEGGPRHGISKPSVLVSLLYWYVIELLIKTRLYCVCNLKA